MCQYFFITICKYPDCIIMLCIKKLNFNFSTSEMKLCCHIFLKFELS